MSHFIWIKNGPHLLKAQLMASATRPIADTRGNSADSGVGAGGINILKSWRNAYVGIWEGSNSDWINLAHNDGDYNFYIDKYIYLSHYVSKVKIVLAWVTRGEYTFANRNNADPMGLDLDVFLKDPSMTQVAYSAEGDNPSEIIEYDPVVSGTYRIQIARHRNDDPDNDLRIGLWASYIYEWEDYNN